MTTTINGRTPEEIKKGLECCNAFNACPSCPYEHIVDTEHGWGCVVIRNADTLAYIQQLENHIGELTEMVQQLERERDAALEAQPKWISVEERLPEESVTVLVYRDGCCGVARLLDVEPITMWTYTGFGGDPTHWMLLPEAPKEEA